MAKSPIAKSAGNRTRKVVLSQKSIESTNVTDLDLSVTFVPTMGSPTSFNFRDWCHIHCDPTARLFKPSRFDYMLGLYRWVERQRKDMLSDIYICCCIRTFMSYIKFCDSIGSNAFDRIGYLAYCGNDGELWRQVKLAIEPKRYLFQYHNNEELGISELSAQGIRTQINKILNSIGFDVSAYQYRLKPLKAGRRLNPWNNPYQPVEWNTMLRRLNFYFTSLATQLIAHRDDNPNSPPPNMLEVEVDQINGRYATVTVGANIQGLTHGYTASSPFYQCMLSGYLLFSYYTAFNTSSILAVRHPISPMKKSGEGKTNSYVKVKAYKGRANKDVEALFLSASEDSHPQAVDDAAGFIVADVNKRDKNGIQDGVSFIEVMSMFSEAYSNEKYGRLFYTYNKENKLMGLDIGFSLGPQVLSEKLGVFSHDRSNLTDYFVELCEDLMEESAYPAFTKVTSPQTGFIVIKKENKLAYKTRIKSRVIELAFASLTCLTDVQLNGIVMPLYYSKKEEDGTITIDFRYADGTKGSFKIAAKYQLFLEKVEAFSQRYNPTHTKYGHPSKTKIPPYLLPLGGKWKTYQWESIESIISHRILWGYGIGHGDFLLNVTASRIRATTSILEYRDGDKGFSARQILQHTIQTQEKSYVNGHPTENSKMVSQGLSALIKIAKGQHRNNAVEEVKKELSIPILAYEKYKQRNMPTNPNGIACDGRPSFLNTQDFHYSARKFAEHEGIIDEVGDIACYQYDLCVFCKSAQLVDDPHSVYKLLSFLEAIQDASDLFPERSELINRKVERFKHHISSLPLETVDSAEALLDEHGRYFIFKTTDSVIQHLSFR
ncbi:hypothetical protein [Vibrio splendidus]|uniref:Uncharacterized protein n=1 Tax=Vibrio splendidus TaxID=29497 RepID=A0A2N7JZD5_VIBSP|nr:hypothetical protein [Vibrio splendidus]PMM65991.1 hypothetical protein BCT54_16240 [Vibrio splendidus]